MRNRVTDRMVPSATFAYVPYQSAKGPSGFAYLKKTEVIAVGESGNECVVLMSSSSDWLTVSMTADAFVTLIGGSTE